MLEIILFCSFILFVSIFIILKVRRSSKVEWVPDFSASYGIDVKLSPNVKKIVNSQFINTVVNQLIKFWHQQFKIEDIERALNKLDIGFVDQKFIQMFGVKANGFYNPSVHYAGIATIPNHSNYTEKEMVARIISLLKHEISHAILFKLTSLDTEQQHKLFSKLQLGA